MAVDAQCDQVFFGIVAGVTPKLSVVDFHVCHCTARLTPPAIATQNLRPRQKPERVIADRGYDSDPLRQRLRRRGIELIVPYRENNQHRRYQDGRKLRRYKRRWIVERTHAWLGQFRRLLVRHEYLLSTYRAFFYIACFWITLRRCF